MPVFLKANWQNLIMANYAVPPSLLQPYLPGGVELDLFQGKCYVSLVGFLFKQTRLFNVPIPFLGTFEEINLRFYVKRKVGNDWRRGVVFINETVPYKAVAYIANKLYKEHYTAVSTRHNWEIDSDLKKIGYSWKKKNSWNHIRVQATNKPVSLEPGSFAEFIFEHYYGYTKVREGVTEEYAVRHPRWQVNDLISHEICCDFAAMYGPSFGWLSDAKPDAVFLAEGSGVTVDWKRVTI